MTRSLLILMPHRREDALRLSRDLGDLLPGVEVRVWPDVKEPEAVAMVVSWQHPPRVLATFPNLEAVASFGAGVEHIFLDDSLPPGVPILRTVDESLVRDMAEYVALAVSGWRRNRDEHHRAQANGLWRLLPYPDSTSVLVLGGGRLGAAAARALAALGMRASVWSRTPKSIDGVPSVVGRNGLHGALPEADAVVCLLPLTAQTENILSADFFERMQDGSLLVNVGRGRHLVDEDLLAALERGRPGHVVLDVFREEPLPEDHPFWSHPRITVTPHVAALTDPRGAAERVAENWRRLAAGEELLDVVDVDSGY